MSDDSDPRDPMTGETWATPWKVYSLLSVSGVLVLSMIGYMAYAGIRMTAMHAPLGNAAMEIKLAAATAHLWFEEIITGDRHEEIGAVWKHLDTAEWYAKAMLQGGTSEEGTIYPLEDPQLRQKIQEVQAKLAQFRNITRKRLTSAASAGVGSDIDQQYDAVFRDFIAGADDVETALHAKIRVDLRRFKDTQYTLMAFVAVLFGLAGLVLRKYERGKADAFNTIQSARHRAETSEKLFADTMRGMGDGVIATDPHGHVTYINPVAVGLTGWNAEQAKHRPVTEVFHIVNEETGQRAENPVDRVIRENLVVGLANHTVLISREGSARPIADSGAPILDENEELLGVVLVFHDISERKQAEVTLRRMEMQLAHAARLSSMGEMVAGIAHEVNQPFYSILNFAKASRNVLAAEGELNRENLREWIDEIAASATRGGEIIKRLRRFVGKTESTRAHSDINRIVGESVQLVAFEASRHHVALQTELSPACPAVNVDRIEIQQVLVNLLRNAFEAMDEPGRREQLITVGTTTAGEFVEVSVTDNGPGLPADAGTTVFDAFTTTKNGGMGMGLAISRTIIEAHGGRLWSTPVPDGGTTFRFALPFSRESQTDVE